MNSQPERLRCDEAHTVIHTRHFTIINAVRRDVEMGAHLMRTARHLADMTCVKAGAQAYAEKFCVGISDMKCAAKESGDELAEKCWVYESGNLGTDVNADLHQMRINPSGISEPCLTVVEL